MDFERQQQALISEGAAYKVVCEELRDAIEQVEYFSQPEAWSLGGARYWMRQAQERLERLHTLAVAAERL